MSRYGSARSNASRGPETATVIFPARTTLGLPITGAASRAVPRPAISARTQAEASAETVEQSTSTRGADGDEDDVPGRQFRGAARGLGAQPDQRLGLAHGAVEDGEITASLEEPATHLHAHATDAQPAEPVRVITSSHIARPSLGATTDPATVNRSQSFASPTLAPRPILVNAGCPTCYQSRIRSLRRNTGGPCRTRFSVP